MTTAPAIAAPPKGEAWHNRSTEEVLAHLGSAATGLSAQEAAQRLAANGPNELQEGKRISPLRIFLGQFKSLIIWILIAAGVISGALGEVVDAQTQGQGFLFLVKSRQGEASFTRRRESSIIPP